MGKQTFSSNDTIYPAVRPLLFENWAKDFLAKVPHPNTRKRYQSSVGKLNKAFRSIPLNEIAPVLIEDFVEARLAEGVEPGYRKPRPACAAEDATYCRTKTVHRSESV